MFSSITESFKSIAKGPRAILAEKISEVLSEHFVLNPKDVESNLLDDARIVLKNTQLRKKQYIRAELPNTIVSIDGVVKEVIFSWRWSFASSAARASASASASGDGKTTTRSSSGGYASSGGMIQDVCLTIKGLDVTFGLQAVTNGGRGHCDLDENEQSKIQMLVEEGLKLTASVTTSSSNDTTKRQGFMQEYLQQIVDHLTLKIDDFRFVIQACNGGGGYDGEHKKGPSVEIVGEGIELGTLASHHHSSSSSSPKNEKKKGAASTVLSQRLAIESFAVNIIKDHSRGSGDDNTPSSSTYPLLEPFGYVVSVTRLSGTRFQGGILSGLKVIGLPELVKSYTTEEGDIKQQQQQQQQQHQQIENIRLHVGREQMETLGVIGLLLTPPEPTLEVEGITSKIGTRSNSMKTHDEGANVPVQAPTVEFSEKCAIGENFSTIFHLPLPGLTLVLPPPESEARSEQEREREQTGKSVPVHSQTQIILPGATTEFRTDGKVFHIKGQDGIKHNDETLVDLIDDGEWEIDFVAKTFHLRGSNASASANTSTENKSEPTDANNPLGGQTFIHIRQASMERIVSSISSLMQNDDVNRNMTKLQNALEDQMENANESYDMDSKGSDAWSFSADPIIIRLEGMSSDSDSGNNPPIWIEAHLSNSHVIVSQEGSKKDSKTHIPIDLEVESVTLQSSLDNDSYVKVPSISLKGDTLHVPGIIEGSLQSTDEIETLKDFLFSFMEGVTSKFTPSETDHCAMHSNDETQSNYLPALKIDHVNFSIKSRSLVVNLTNINIISISEQNTLSCETVICSEGPMKIQHLNTSVTLNTLSGDPTLNQGNNVTTSSIDINLGDGALYLYKDLNHSTLRGAVKMTPMQGHVNAYQSIYEMELKSNLNLRLEGPNDEWFEGCIESSKASVDVGDSFRLISLHSNGAHISSSSFGYVTIDVPSVTMSPDKSSMTVGGEKSDSVHACFGSTVIMSQIQAFVTNMIEQHIPTKASSSEASTYFPISFLIPRFNLSVADHNVIMESAAAELNSIKLDHLQYDGPDDAYCVMKEVSAVLGTKIEITCDIHEGIFPQIAQFACPTRNIKVSMEENFSAIRVVSDTIKVLMLRSMFSSSSTKTPDAMGGVVDFPVPLVNISIDRFQLCSVPEENIRAQVSGMKLNLSSVDDLLSIETLEEVRMRLTHANEWIQGSLRPLLIALPNTLTKPEAMTCAGFSINSSSLGDMFIGDVSVMLPQFTLLPESNVLTMESPMQVNVGSLELAQKMHKFLSDTFQLETKVEGRSSASPLLIPIQVEQMNICIQESTTHIIVKSISLENFVTKCASLSYQDANHNVVYVEGIETNFETNSCTKIDAIATLSIPGIIKLKRPIQSTSILYAEGSIRIHVNAMYGIMERSKAKSPHGESSDISIPLPIQMNIDSLILDAGPGCTILCQTLQLSLDQSGSSILFKTRRSMKVRIMRSQNEWINSELGCISLILQQSDGNIVVQKAEFSGGVIGPCSSTIGTLLATIPPIHMNADKWTASDKAIELCSSEILRFEDDIAIELCSPEILDKARPLLDAINESFCSEMQNEPHQPLIWIPFSVIIPGITLSVQTPASKINMINISASGSVIDIVRTKVSVQGNLSSSVKDIHIDFATHDMTMGWVESLFVPGSVALSQPLADLKMNYRAGNLHVNIPSPVLAEMLSNTKPQASTSSSNQQGEIVLPFPITLGINQMSVKEIDGGDESCIKLQKLAVNLVPADLPSHNQDLLSDAKKGACISLSVADIRHKLFHVKDIKTSLLTPLGNIETIDQLCVSLDSANINAGFSSVDWSSFLLEETGVQQKILRTPHATIEKFILSISFEGTIIASHAKIHIPLFNGDASTTTDDLKSHYSKIVLQRAPGFLTNTEFLGGNVVDSSFSHLGQLAVGASSLTGAGFGSVVGVAVSDGVKNAIRSGKVARNATEDEGYKFGDITRGIMRGSSEASKIGASTRGSDGSDYIPGDLTIGAAAAVGEYAGNNKHKLASAGGAGVASVVGMAVAGPLGFLAGSYIGNKVGGAIVEDDTSKGE